MKVSIVGTNWGLDSAVNYSDLFSKSVCGIARGNGKSFYQAAKWKSILRPTVEKVIFNGPATIVLWSDNTKTVVKCDDEKFDKEKGLAMAIAKRFLGTNKSGSNYYDVFKKWIPEEPEIVTEEITLYMDNEPYKTFRAKIADAFKLPVSELEQKPEKPYIEGKHSKGDA